MDYFESLFCDDDNDYDDKGDKDNNDDESIDIEDLGGEEPESECSYDFNISRVDFTDHIIAIMFSKGWLFLTSLSAFILFFIDSYTVLFHPVLMHNLEVLVCRFIINMLVICDTSFMIIRIFKERESSRNMYIDQPKVLTIIDISTCSAILIDLFHIWNNLPQAIIYLRNCIIFIRNYKIFSYFYNLITNNISTTKFFIATKYFLLYAIVLHTFACGFRLLCTRCNTDKYPKNTIYGNVYFIKVVENNYMAGLHDKQEPAHWEVYALTMYHIIGHASNTGFSLSSPRNNGEQLLSIILIVVATLIKIQFLSEVYCLTYVSRKVLSNYSNKLQIIAKRLSNEGISSTIRKKIINYYLTVWEKENDLDLRSYTYLLPKGMVEDINLDKYCFAINQMYFFHDQPLTVKRMISNLMITTYYHKNDVIEEQGSYRNKLQFIASGSVAVLSEEDAESSLLNLGIGACLGEINIFYPQTCRFSLVAKSYTIIYSLSIEDLWRFESIRYTTAIECIRNKMRERLRSARNCIQVKGYNDRVLMTIKEKLTDESVLNIYDTRKVAVQERSDSPLDGYIVSKIQNQMSGDSIFFSSRFLWKLQENSKFIWFWDTMITVMIVILLLIWPYLIYYSIEEETLGVYFYGVNFKMFFILDVLVQLLTVCETKEGIFYKIKDILRYRWSVLLFFDIAAAFPYTLFFSLPTSRSTFIVSHSLLLLKLFKLPVFINKVQKRFLFMKLVRIDLAKYVLYIFIASYMTAWLYYAIICYKQNEECLAGSWLHTVWQNMKTNHGQEGVNIYHTYRFMMLIQFSVMAWTMTTWYTSYTMIDVILGFILSMASLLVYIYFIAEFSASGTLANEIRYKYMLKVDDMVQYMDKRSIRSELRKITLEYLEARWDYDLNLCDRSLFWGLTEKLFDEVQTELYIKLFKNEPLFSMVDNETLNMIASRCRTLFVPPGLTIVHGGALVDEMYIIDSGYCQLTTPLTKKIKAVLSSKSGLCVLECLLGEGNVYDIKAVTHVSLAIIKREHLLKAFAASPLKLNDQLSEAINTIKNMDSRIFTTHNTKGVKYHHLEEDLSSWVVFSRTRNIQQFIYYKDTFRNRSCGRFLRFFLMARTIRPNGHFCKRWEMVRNLLAWLACTCYPAKFIYVSIIPQYPHLLLIFDIFMMIDIYLQCHVCFYNEKAILVTHPYVTCKNYLSSRFLLDFLGAIPLGRILRWLADMEPVRHYHYLYENMGDLNKFLLLIRTRCLLEDTKVLGKPKIFGRLLYFSMILILLYNFFACLLTYTTNDFYKLNGELKMRPRNNSWYYSINVPTSDNYLELYAYAYGIVALDMLDATPFMQFISFDPTLSLFRIICVTFGYLFFIYSTVQLIVHFKINRKVSEYELNMNELREFLKRENISKDLIKAIIEHFDYVWRRTAQVFHSICQINSMSIRQDYALLIYGDTISRCTPFQDVDNSFKRQIGVHFKDEYYETGNDIVLLNDIVNNVFIIHSGIVTVQTADGSELDFMGRGGMFGNFDEMKMIRSMITVKATEDVELVRIRTEMLNEVFAGHPDILFKLREYCKYNSLGYIRGKARARSMDYGHKSIFQISVKNALHKYHTSYYPILIEIFIGVATYLSVTTLLAFNGGEGSVQVIHILDVLVLFKLALNMFRYRVYYGTTFCKRFKRRWKNSSFVLDIISIVPFDMVFLFIVKDPIEAYYATFTNRLLRMIVLFKYFKSINFSSSKHAVFAKIGLMISFTLLTVHSGSCLLHNLDAKGFKSWAYYNGEAVCDNYYICATYISLTYFTARGNEMTLVENIADCTVTIIFTTVSRYVFAVIVGSAIGIAAHIKFTYMEFNFVAGKLERSLEKSNISPYLLHNVLRYLTNIYLKNKGKQYPAFMLTAPRVLRGKIKVEAFGMHIYNNVLFHGCHADFIRQLVSHMQLSHFFYGDTICHMGSINSTMYFVHRGQVEVGAERKMDFNVIDILSPGDSFGIIQGLYKTKEHIFTYVARNNTEILSLQYEDWNYLLTFFPASKFSIFEEVVKRKNVSSQTSGILNSINNA